MKLQNKFQLKMFNIKVLKSQKLIKLKHKSQNNSSMINLQLKMVKTKNIRLYKTKGKSLHLKQHHQLMLNKLLQARRWSLCQKINNDVQSLLNNMKNKKLKLLLSKGYLREIVKFNLAQMTMMN